MGWIAILNRKLSPPLIVGQLTLCLWFVSCGSAPTEPTSPPTSGSPEYGGTIRIAQSAAPSGLHPMLDIGDGPNEAILEHLHLKLFGLNSQTLAPEPCLATDLAEISSDGLTFTYTLRQAAQWDNGDPITGYDYAFSLKCIKNPLSRAPVGPNSYDFVEDVIVDASNPQKFSVVTKEPFFLAQTRIEAMTILSANFYDSLHVFDKYSIPDFQHRIGEIKDDAAILEWTKEFESEKYHRDLHFLYGAGPYRVESWDAGGKITLIRKRKWWGDAVTPRCYCFQAYLDKLIFKTIPEEQSRVSAAKNGECDVVTGITASTFQSLKEDHDGVIARNFHLYSTAGYSTTYLGFNCRPSAGGMTALSDVRVRKAIAHCVDIETIISNIYEGKADVQVGPISHWKTDEYDSTLIGNPFDLKKAQQILDDAGWLLGDDGIRHKRVNGQEETLQLEVLISNTSETSKRILRSIQPALKSVGISLTTKEMTFSELTERRDKHQFQLLITGRNENFRPTDLSQEWSTASWVNRGRNWWGFGNAVTDSLIEKIRHTQSAADRKPLYHEFQRLWLEELPNVVIVAQRTLVLISKKLQNAREIKLGAGYSAEEMWIPKSLQGEVQ
jgi:ABC-type transport system substrate-binding protein